MKQIRLYISGLVQGVGFRNFVRSKAKKFEITGWVRNLTDGRVEVVAQGTDEKLTEFIEVLNKGHFFSEVKNVEKSWEEVAEIYDSFDKKPTV